MLNQNYNRNWLVRVDGKKRPTEITKGLVSVHVQQGDHEIVFYFFPMLVAIGAVISIFTAAGGLIIVITMCYKRGIKTHITTPAVP